MKSAPGRPQKIRPRPQKNALPDGPASLRALTVRRYLLDLVRRQGPTTSVPLPSSRDLAATLGVSLNTVTHACRLLREDGILAGESGRGTFLATTRTRGVSLVITNRFRLNLGSLSLFSMLLTQYIETQLENAGYLTQAVGLPESGAEPPAPGVLERLCQNRFDFLVDLGSGQWHEKLEAAVKTSGLPVLSVLTPHPHPLHHLTLRFDFEDFRKKARGLIIEKKPGRVLWARAHLGSSNPRVATTENPPGQIAWVTLPKNGDFDGAAREIDGWLTAFPKTDMVVVENDVWAAVIHTRALALGLKPHFIVLSHPAIPRHFVGPITRIDADRDALGRHVLAFAEKSTRTQAEKENRDKPRGPGNEVVEIPFIRNGSPV